MKNIDRFEFVENPDSLHCTQAAFIMALKLLGNPTLSMSEAEHLTGFREGVETWPYGMICALAEFGFEVRHIDGLSAVDLTSDPVTTLERSGLDKETLDYFLRITDFSQERQFVTRALNTGLVEFETRAPTVNDILEALNDGWLPIISLDAAVLNSRPRNGFEGHVVLALGLERGKLIVSDPGPPPEPRLEVSSDVLAAAMRSPTEDSGTVTLVRATV
jgi:hypothetical protein